VLNQKIKRGGVSFFRIYDYFCNVCAHISAWMMLIMALIITYEVIVRYFFVRPTIWVSDTADYIMLYSTFLISAWLLKHDGHVRLTFLLDHLSSRSRLKMEVVNSFIGAFLCAIIFWYGLADTLDAFAKNIEISRPFAIPKYPIIGVIPLGFLLLFLQFLRKAFNTISFLKGSSSTGE
jgi:TRAP-type C4-dicarboxylate transport system permease small subunit